MVKSQLDESLREIQEGLVEVSENFIRLLEEYHEKGLISKKQMEELTKTKKKFIMHN